MKLYYSTGACSLAPHIALKELELPFEAVKVSLKDKTYAGGDYRKVNPKGSVPVIELDNGEVLTEIPAILQYLADQKPEANLVPRNGTWARTRCQEWLNYIATELHKSFGPLWKADYPEQAKKIAIEKLSKEFDFLSTRLKEHEFLMDTYTVADAYALTILGWTKPLKLDLTKWPSIMGYMEKLRTRPAVVAAMKAEGLIKTA